MCSNWSLTPVRRSPTTVSIERYSCVELGPAGNSSTLRSPPTEDGCPCSSELGNLRRWTRFEQGPQPSISLVRQGQGSKAGAHFRKIGTLVLCAASASLADGQ